MDELLVGRRIKEGREALALGQEVLAQRVGIPRTALSAIENGKRQVTAPELLRFSEALGRPLDFLLRPEGPRDFDFQPLFRLLQPLPRTEEEESIRGRPKKGHATDSVREVLVQFEELCKKYVELKEINEFSVTPLLQFPFTPDRFMFREAERLANIMRTKLGLGTTAPATQLRELLEEQFSIKTFVLRSGGKLSGACIYHERVGGCILVIAKTIPHMLFTLAHEFAHLLVHRDTPVVDIDLYRKDSNEQFANAFAASLLMPRDGVQELFFSIYSSRKEFTDIDVIHMARHFGVSFDAMLSRLQGLRMIAPGARKLLLDAYREMHTGPAKRAAEKGLGPLKIGPWAPLPERYKFLAMRAYRREEISIGRLAEYLCNADGESMSIAQAQEFIEQYQTQNGIESDRLIAETKQE